MVLEGKMSILYILTWCLDSSLDSFANFWMLPQRTEKWFSDEESTCQCRRCRFDPKVGKILWRRKWQLTPVLLPGKFHGQRSLVGYSPWGCKRVRHSLETKQQQIHPEVGLLGLTISISHFLRNAILFSRAVALFHIPRNSPREYLLTF